MKIAIFSDTYLPEVNGVASHVHALAEGLAERGNEVQVYTLSKVKENTLNKKFGRGFKIETVFSVPAFIYPDARFTLPTGTTYPKIRKFKPDIIHVHTPFAIGWEGIFNAKILKVPLVATHHTFYNEYLKHLKVDCQAARKFTWKYTIGFHNYCDLVLCPSQSLVYEMQDHKLKKPVEVMPNFIDTDFFHPPKNIREKELLKRKWGLRGKTLVYLGRLSYEKSIEKVIQVFSLIVQKKSDANLLIIGDGPEKKNLKNLAKKLGVADKTIFTGFLRGKKLVEALRTADVFMTASVTETFCLAALEAMAVGLPIVASSARGLKEVASDGINGYLIDPQETVEMSKKVLKMFGSEKLWKRFSSASRKLAEDRSREKLISDFINRYEKAIKNYRQKK